MTTQLLIVGAGPVGLTLAAECLRHGVNFRIVDQAEGPSNHSKALVVWSGTIEHLATLGLAQTFLEASRPIREMIFEDTGRQIAQIPLTEGLDSLYASPFVLPQSRTERLLLTHLRDKGIEVERNCECFDVRVQPEGVSCDLKRTDGSTETIEAAWLAGCDGARSRVRQKLPVSFPGITEGVGFILADAKATGGLGTDSILVSSGSGGNVIIFPVEEEIWRIFALREQTNDHSNPTLEEIQQHLDGAGLDRVRLSDPVWLSYFTVNERVVSRNRVGRAFLLGDASHIHSPAGGQGMNTGMQDAFNLGWKLKMLTNGCGDEESIAESYFLERHPIAEKVVCETSRLLHFGIINRPLVRTAKRGILPILSRLGVVKKTIAHELSEIGISYPNGPLIETDSKAFRHQKDLRPGCRARPVDVLKEGAVVSLWSELLHPGFSLLIFGDSSPSRIPIEALSTMLAEARVAIRPVAIRKPDAASVEIEGALVLLDPNGAAHARYGVKEFSWYLIRPDQYIAARGTQSELEVLLRYIRRIS